MVESKYAQGQAETANPKKKESTFIQFVKSIFVFRGPDQPNLMYAKQGKATYDLKSTVQTAGMIHDL